MFFLFFPYKLGAAGRGRVHAARRASPGPGTEARTEAPTPLYPPTRAQVVPPLLHPARERTRRDTERGGDPARCARQDGCGPAGPDGTGPEDLPPRALAHGPAECGAAGERRGMRGLVVRHAVPSGVEEMHLHVVGRRPPGRSWVGRPGLTVVVAPGPRARGLRSLRDRPARGRPRSRML